MRTRTKREVAVEVTAATIKRGDLITVGGKPMLVTDLITLAGGAKRIRFKSGELLSIHAETRLIALRVVRGW